MKNRLLALCIFLILNSNVGAQTHYLLAGLATHPGGPELDSTCWNGEYGGYSWGIHCREVQTSPGFGFYLGFGSKIPLGKHWKIQNIAKAQFLETPVHMKGWTYDKQSIKDLVYMDDTRLKYRYTNLQISVALERILNLKQREWSVYGGGFLRIKVQDWVNIQGTHSDYFTDLVVESVYDSLEDVYYTVLASKRELDKPILNNTKNTVGQQSTHFPIQYGVMGGISFPIKRLDKWQMRGQAMVSQDFNISFRGVEGVPTYRQTFLTTGIVLSPNSIKDASFPTFDWLRPKPKVPGKKMPMKGFQTGYSQHELFFSSLNIGYLTGKKFGVDFSLRSPIFWGTEVVTAFIGPVYQIDNSRFFAKGGVEFIFLGDDFDDEYSQDDYNFEVIPYIGAKYQLPLTRNLGLHTELGFYPLLSNNLPILPSLGVGLVIAPFGVK